MKIKVCLIKGEDKVLESIVLGNILDNIISFKIEDMLNTIDINKEFFIRENDEYKFFRYYSLILYHAENKKVKYLFCFRHLLCLSTQK